MVRRKILRALCLAVAGLIFFVSLPSDVKANEGYFFSGVQDLPLMPGLKELPDQAVRFDKAEGRIIELYALVGAHSEEEILGFYDKAMPQFGWVRIESGRYRREGEVLRLVFVPGEPAKGNEPAGQDYLKIMITPSSGE